MKCVYCQAQNGESIPNGMMSKYVAKRAVDIALSSPSKSLSFEFQGGEPFLNFNVIKYIVEYTKKNKNDKIVEFNVVSNLTLINAEIAQFIKENNIGISTSIDGDEDLHNKNRMYSTNGGTYADTVRAMNYLRQIGVNVGAIETTTRYSLNCSNEIVNAYVSLGLNNLFLRPLTPLGCANRYWSEIGYSPEAFIKFYKECFDYIITLNEKGIYIKEGHASIMLSKF